MKPKFVLRHASKTFDVLGLGTKIVIQVINNEVTGIFCDETTGIYYDNEVAGLSVKDIKSWAEKNMYKCSDNISVLGTATTRYKKEVYR